MESCWAEASSRPTFGDLVNTLSEMNLPTPRYPHPRVKGGSTRLSAMKPETPKTREQIREEKKLRIAQGSISLSPNPKMKALNKGRSSDSESSEEEAYDESVSLSSASTSFQTRQVQLLATTSTLVSSPNQQIHEQPTQIGSPSERSALMGSPTTTPSPRGARFKSF